MGKKAFKWINNIVTYVLIILLIGVAALVVSSKVSGGEPKVFGYQIKTVLSGSMEPGIKTGSVIVVKPGGDMTRFKEGEVITFLDEEERLITHRITEVSKAGDQVSYRTKGDNNNAEDPNPVLAQNVVAEYAGITVPYVGYIADFAQSKNGILFLVIFPGILLLGYAAYSIWKTLALLERQYKSNKLDSTPTEDPPIQDKIN